MARINVRSIAISLAATRGMVVKGKAWTYDTDRTAIQLSALGNAAVKAGTITLDGRTADKLITVSIDTANRFGTVDSYYMLDVAGQCREYQPIDQPCAECGSRPVIYRHASTANVFCGECVKYHRAGHTWIEIAECYPIESLYNVANRYNMLPGQSHTSIPAGQCLECLGTLDARGGCPDCAAYGDILTDPEFDGSLDSGDSNSAGRASAETIRRAWLDGAGTDPIVLDPGCDPVDARNFASYGNYPGTYPTVAETAGDWRAIGCAECGSHCHYSNQHAAIVAYDRAAVDAYISAETLAAETVQNEKIAMLTAALSGQPLPTIDQHAARDAARAEWDSYLARLLPSYTSARAILVDGVISVVDSAETDRATSADRAAALGTVDTSALPLIADRMYRTADPVAYVPTPIIPALPYGGSLPSEPVLITVRKQRIAPIATKINSAETRLKHIAESLRNIAAARDLGVSYAARQSLISACRAFLSWPVDGQEDTAIRATMDRIVWDCVKTARQMSVAGILG